MTDATTVIPTVAAAAEREFRIGPVFGRTATLLSRNFPIYFAVAAVGSVPLALFEKTSVPLIDDSATLSLIAGLLMLLLGPISQAIILHVAFQDMRGQPVSLMAAVRATFARILPLIGLTICMGVAIAVGVLLLVIPALILVTMWYAAMSVCVVERQGVFASMERSSKLTKGQRWPIFGTWLLFAIAGAILAEVVKSMIGLTGSAGLVTAGSLAWSASTTAFGIVFAAGIYHDLRVAKEGIDIRQIAAVFE
jgi:hypothetical protein